MGTQRPSATISYNSKEFLVEKLETLIKAHIISAYQFIFHYGEDGDKDHFHLRVEPNKKLDMMALAEEFNEYDATHPDKPLGVKKFGYSKEEDWLMYAVHDQAYLKYHCHGGDPGEKLPYSDSDIVVSEGYDLRIAMHRARGSVERSAPGALKKLEDGESVADLIRDGINPFVANALNNALQNEKHDRHDAQRAYKRMQDALNKAGLKFDPVSGEINNPDGHVYRYDSETDVSNIDIGFVKEHFKDDLPFND